MNYLAGKSWTKYYTKHAFFYPDLRDSLFISGAYITKGVGAEYLIVVNEKLCPHESLFRQGSKKHTISNILLGAYVPGSTYLCFQYLFSLGISYLETHSRLGTVTILSFSGGLIASVLDFVFSVDVSSFIFSRAVVVKFRLISLLSNLIFLK